ncbi:hypothetical protein Hanom_Chr11g01060871 [Helianthus anomalus]
MSFGYHPEIDPLLRPTIQPKRTGMLSLSGMKIVKKFPPDNHKNFKGPNGQPFRPVDLPTEFELIDPPTVPGQVAVHDPEVYIPDPPQVSSPAHLLFYHLSIPATCWVRSCPLTRGVSTAT